MPKRRRRPARLDRFALDMLVLSVFTMRHLPNEHAYRIMERAEREMTFVSGVHRARKRYVEAGLIE